MNFKRIIFLFIFFLSLFIDAKAQHPQSKIHFRVSIPEPAKHYFDVKLTYQNPGDSLVLKMPVWSPGGYFLTNPANQLENFSATDATGDKLVCTTPGNSSWAVITKGTDQLIVRYRIKCLRPFIDQPWVEENWGLIGPTGMFLYTDKDLKLPVTVTIEPSRKWTAPLATGMDTVAGMHNTFVAGDFDILYDSPILMGNLESLEPFYINNIPHYFIGYEIGEINRKEFMANLQKITAAGINIINDIPYKHYKYLSIGYGPGGIEHLNSTVVSFRSKRFLDAAETRFRNYKLLAHEYFHHYNVKRIRPVELGPFDYSGPNYTKLLWFAEGVTEYYAHIMMLRSGLATMDEVNRSFQSIIRNYENKPGRLYQSLSQASLSVWDNSPFSKTKAQADRTISYYEKGCITGLLIDLDIRYRSKNKYSLDDVMRFLYKKYYQELKRGFTDAELKEACELFAGGNMDEVFSYANTTAAVNYPKYFGYAGLVIDTLVKPGPYLGFTTGVQLRTYMVLNSVEEGGPAWNAGLRVGDTIITMQGKEPSIEVLNETLISKKPGEKFVFEIKKGELLQTVALTIGSRLQKMFTIAENRKKDKLQKEIFDAWRKEKK